MTAPKCADFEGIECWPERLWAYSGVQNRRALVLRPKDEEQLRRIFDCAAERKWRITFRAGGRSFDAQSLGYDLVVSMDRFDSITVDGGTVTVGAGATWGRILRTLAAHGKLPAGTVTTELASAGGTMSGNCLSRFSPAYGKEGKHITRFTLLTPSGERLTCTRPEGQPGDLAQETFLAAIGGLGYLGAVLDITYKLLEAPDVRRPTVVKTTVGRTRDLNRYVRGLVGCVKAMHSERSSPQNGELLDAVYTAIDLRADGRTRAFIFVSTYSGDAEGRPLLVYQPRHPLRVPTELLFRFRLFNALLWWANFEIFHRRTKHFVNALMDYAFFMDGNTRAKRFAARFRVNLQTLQQTFVVPSDFSSEDAVEQTIRDLKEWLLSAAAVFERHGITPTFHDVLWLPHDPDFRLSSTPTTGGFAVSYAFDSNRGKRRDKATEAFKELAEAVHQREGRVYLVKNVYAETATLQAMYDTRLTEFRNLKRRLDPDDLLVNPFYDEKLAV
jgi:decaprenylphospho-beta-D-ribofuranose 2-oxidase